jgi:hypothetical protein
LLAPPEPSNNVKDATPVSIGNGRTLFNDVGCALCHTPMLHTVKPAIGHSCEDSPIPQLCDQDVKLFSDLALHHMGAKLDDGITQGQAERDEFRTAPLWGLGKRIFSCTTAVLPIWWRLLKSIIVYLELVFVAGYYRFFRYHNSVGLMTARLHPRQNAVVDQYNGLSDKDKQDLLNFLRSL